MSNPIEQPTLAQQLRDALPYVNYPLRGILEKTAARLAELEHKFDFAVRELEEERERAETAERRLAAAAQAERERCLSLLRNYSESAAADGDTVLVIHLNALEMAILTPHAGEEPEADRSTPPIPGLPVSPEIRARVEAEMGAPREVSCILIEKENLEQLEAVADAAKEYLDYDGWEQRDALVAAMRALELGGTAGEKEPEF